MRKHKFLNKFLCFVFCFLSIFSFADEIRKLDPVDYSKKVAELNSNCASKGMPVYSGFCLSKEYGKATYNNPTQTSITLALGIASFEHFYSNCEHSDFPTASTLLTKAKSVFDTGSFYEEMKPQREALESYVSRFYFCKTKNENDATILNQLKYFQYMVGQFAKDGGVKNIPATKTVTSNKPAKSVVGCITSQYKRSTNDPFENLIVDGVLAKDESITVVLFSPMRLALAQVVNIDGGSVTQYINTDHEKYASIPRPNDFTNAVTGCQ